LTDKKSRNHTLPVVGIVAIGCLLIASPPVAHATFRGANGKNGKIAFIAPGEAGHYDIFTIHMNGTHKRKLTDTVNHEFSPNFSPLGRVIAYDRHGDVARMQASGKNKTVLGGGTQPAFSPNGERVAFVRPQDDEIYIRRATDGGGSRRVTVTPGQNSADSPAWSSKGKIAYVREQGGPHLRQVNPNGTGDGPFGGTDIMGFAPDWSPDGRKLLYTYYDDDGDVAVYMVNKDGSNNHMVHGGFGQTIDFREAVWSPNGKWFLMESKGEFDDSVLLLVKRDGSVVKNIPHTAKASSPTWQGR
jgi:Tol biopolymer transport system component